MPVTRKVEPGPLEKIDQFITEQKNRREAFWIKRNADKGPGSIATSTFKKAPSAKPAHGKGKPNAEQKLWNPVNCVEHEALAIRAIQARTDAIQRLAQCCERVDDHIATRRGFVCNSDPVLKMFFRLVANVRVKTIDAVECVSSWERNVGRGRPFIHNGSPYLPALGEELRCLDEFDFVRVRVRRQSCSEDPFLCDLTPLGVPIEPTSAFELRQGGRVNQAALRLRMAIRTVEPFAAALQHSRTAGLASKSILAHLSPPGKKSETHRGPGTRIPDKSRNASTQAARPGPSHMDSEAASEHLPTGPMDHGSTLESSHSRLPRPPGNAAASGGLRSAPSRLSGEVSSTSASQAAAAGVQLVDHGIHGNSLGSQNSRVLADDGGGAVCEQGQDARSGGPSSSVHAVESEHAATPQVAQGPRSGAGPQPSDSQGHPVVTPDHSSPDLVLPLPPPGTVCHSTPADTSPSASPGCVQPAASANEHVIVRAVPLEYVRVTLSMPACAPATGEGGGAPVSEGPGYAAAGEVVATGQRGTQLGQGAGEGPQGGVRVGLAVVQHVAVEIAVTRCGDSVLRAAPGGSAGRPGSEGVPVHAHERVRVEFVVRSPAVRSSQGQAADRLGARGGEPEGRGTEQGLGASADSAANPSRGGVEGHGADLVRACSLDMAVDEVMEEMIEFVASSLCPGGVLPGAQQGGGPGGGGVGEQPPWLGASSSDTSALAAQAGTAARDWAQEELGMERPEYVCVRLFVEAAQLQGVDAARRGEYSTEGRDGSSAALAQLDAPGAGGADGGVCEAEALCASVSLPCDGELSGTVGDGAAGADGSACDGGTDGGGVAVGEKRADGDHRAAMGREDGASPGAVTGGREESGLGDARVSATSVVVDEVVQEVLQHALLEGAGSAEGDLGMV